MMKGVLICLSFFVAYCCATGLTISDLQANTNTAVTGRLTSDRDTDILFYRVFLPRNASSITISITETDDVCDGLLLQGRTGQAPCSYLQDDDNSICQSFSWGEYFDTDVNTYTFNTYPYTNDVTSRFESNQWLYFAVSKEYSEDDDNNCTFSINSITTTYCTSGMTASNDDDEDADCVAYTPFTFGTPIVITNSGNAVSYYATNLPGNSYGRATFAVNITDTDVVFYAKTGSVPSDDVSGYSYDCYSNAEDAENVNGFYIYSFDCITPIGGNWYYFAIFFDDDGTYSATIVPTLTTCSSSGNGGYNCSAPNQAWSPKTATSGPFTIPTDPSYGYGGNAFNYFYYDVNATLPQNPFTFTVSVSSGSGYTYIRYNAYPEYDSPYGYSIGDQYTGIGTSAPESWFVYPSDLVNSARIYFAVSTDTDFALTYSLNGTQSTTGAPTTAAPTSGSNTGNTGNNSSDAVSMIASLFLIVAAFIATLI